MNGTYIFEIVNRTIVPSSTEELAVVNDNDSRYITFKIPSVIDGIDITDKILTVRYVNSLNRYDQFFCNTREVITEGNEQFVLFDWVLSADVTASKGTVTYDVSIYDTNDISNVSQYILHTKPATFEVDEGLLDIGAPIEDENALQTAIDSFNAIAAKYYNDTLAALKAAQASADAAAKSAASLKIDTTLTISGQAADAKVVGDKLAGKAESSVVTSIRNDLQSEIDRAVDVDSQLKEDLGNVNDRFLEYNLFDKHTATVVSIMCNDSLMFITGGGVQSTIWKCEPNTIYNISWYGISGNNRFIIYTSENSPVVDGTSNAIRKIELSNTVSGSTRHYVTITTTSNENYLLLYFWNNASGGEATLDKMQISKGNQLLDYISYEKYAMPNLKIVQAQFEGIEIGVTNCTNDMANLLGTRAFGPLDKGYICLVADDGYANVSNVTFPVVREKNVPVTLALWTKSEVITNQALLSELRTMISTYDVGICQHGEGHFTKYSPKGLYDYLESEKVEWNNLSLDVKGVAYPNHSRNAQVRTVCGALYGVCCCGGKTLPMVYSHDTNGARSNIFDLYRISLYSTSESELKSACDFAKNNNKLVIVFWHDNDIYGVDAQISKLKSIIDYAKALDLTFVNVGDIPSLN